MDLTAAAHPLRADASGRFLVDADGRPFLYLADTAWELFHRLTREEAEEYLRDRADKGFTVVQAVVLGLEGLDVPNATARGGFWATIPGARTRGTLPTWTGWSTARPRWA